MSYYDPEKEDDRRGRNRGDRDEDYDDNYDIDISKPSPPEGELSAGDWLLCIFCSGIACIVGIVRLIQGRPGAGKMVLVALGFSIVWALLRALLDSAFR